MNDRIASMIDKRTYEAIRKDISRKLQVIVKAFGRPIIEQNIPYNVLPDFWELDTPEMLEADDDNVHLRGYYFDGLRRGINLTIKMMIYESHLAELQVTWNGYQVFLESEGELKSYAPFPSWEDAMERLYIYAKPTAEEKIKEERNQKKQDDAKKVMSMMQKLRILWGF